MSTRARNTPFSRAVHYWRVVTPRQLFVKRYELASETDEHAAAEIAKVEAVLSEAGLTFESAQVRDGVSQMPDMRFPHADLLSFLSLSCAVRCYASGR